MTDMELNQDTPASETQAVVTQVDEAVVDNLEAKKKATAKKKPATVAKMKVQLQVPTDHPFFSFGEELKQRKAKGIDLAQLVLDALSAVKEDWWTKKLEELTPIEYRIHLALNNPELREELSSFLEEKLPGAVEENDSVH